MPVRYALVAFMLLCLGCREALSPASADDLTTVVALDRNVLGPADTTVVTVTVRNVTDRSIEYRSSCRAGVFRVYRNGDRVDSFACAIPESELIRLLPGESLSTSSRWTIVTYRGAGVLDTLPAGTYGVVGGVDVLGELRAQSAAVAVEVRTP